MSCLCSGSRVADVSLMLRFKQTLLNLEAQSSAAPTLALSMTFENSPIHTTQCSAVTNRKQSPLFSDDTLGSTSLV